MSKIIFMTNVIRRFGIMQQMLDRLQNNGEMQGDYSCWWITDDTEWNPEAEKRLQGTKFLFMKWMGTGLTTTFLKRVHAYVQQHNIPYYIDASGGDDDILIEGITPEQENSIRLYSVYGGEANLYHLWQYLEGLVAGDTSAIIKPDPIHWTGIFHPRAKKVYTDLAEYEKDFCKPGRLTAGILFYRDEWVWGDLEYQTRMIEEAEHQGLNVICAFSNGMPYKEMGMPTLDEVFSRFFFKNGIPVTDVFINTTKFSLTASSALELDFLKRWDVPVLAAYTLLTEYEEWKDTPEGMNAMEVSISISLPEFDGVIHGVPVATKKELDNGDIRYVPIAERIAHMISKARKWAALRHKANAGKKVAIIFHNYPPKNSNIGSGLGLDTIESVRLLLANMKERGYKVDFIPQDTKEFIKILTSHATNDRSMLSAKQLEDANKISGEEYGVFYSQFEEKVQNQLVKDWGDAPGSVMEYNGKLMVPGTMDGNIFITVQPPRGFGEDPAKIYHSPYCAPTHHYLAFYQWIRDIWKADAVAHIGTHGSLEWLPGKNAGLSAGCYPDLSLRDLPNMYIYNMTITGEGIQAKRRGAAVLDEHLPAPQSQAGTYDELEELEKAMEEYVHFQRTAPENLPRLEELVLAKVKEANLYGEVQREEGQPFEEYLGNLHNYITDLKNMEVHTGLHVLGEPPKDDGLTEYLWLLTRLDNGNVPSLNQTLASRYGYDYYYLLEHSSEMYEPLQITFNMLIDRIGEQCRDVIRILQNHDFSDAGIQAVMQQDWVKEAASKPPVKVLAGASRTAADQNIQETPKSFDEKLRTVCEYICHTVYPNLMLTSQEQVTMLRGFEGEYIEPGPSGAPSSGGADLLPTGRNFYGVDPRTLPTAAAWEIGKSLGDQVISRFIEEEGHYPENIGIVLWAGANMRSHGQCLAEFLYLMGMKPVWQPGSLRVIGLEVMPLNELRRPRIDVTARISGLFRDSMPDAAEMLDKAVLKVAALAEDPEQNYVRKHVLEDSTELEKEEGMAKEEAWRTAAFRIFGDERGVYGAGVAALLEAKNWETIDDIADVYVRWGAHAYGGKTRGKYLPKQFRKRMGVLDITIKNEDNHEVNMLSSDDYNAYHGGMIAAVRSIRGSAPKSYCGDSTDRSRVTMHSLQEETKRLFRSESINPKFIEGMMKHGYKGAADMSNMVANSYQWDATSKVMEDWMYEKYAEKYVLDSKVQEWMRDVNPWALKRTTEVLLEASQRELWHAKEETLQALQRLCLDVDGELEEQADEA